MGKYDGYGWIRVPVFVDDPSKSWEERFKALDAHHKAETTFLIEEVRKLAGEKPPPPEEKNKRLAQTKRPDGTIIEREWTPHERFMLFAKGFRSGAGVRAIDPACEGLGAYDRGYDEGIQARRSAVDAYAKEIGYVPSILRTQPIAVPDLIAGPNPGQPCPDCLLPLGMGCDCATRTD